MTHCWVQLHRCTQSFVARSTTWSGGGVGAKSRLCFFPSIASSNCYINMTWQIKPLRSKCSCPNSKTTLNMAYMCMIYTWPYPPKRVTLILFMKFWFLHTCTNFHFKWYQDLANLPTGSKVIDKNQSGCRREFHSEKLGWENLFRIQQYYGSYNLKCLKLS